MREAQARGCAVRRHPAHGAGAAGARNAVVLSGEWRNWLYYYGMIGTGFRGAGPEAHTTIYIPDDVSLQLPHPFNRASEEAGSNVRPIAPPSAGRCCPPMTLELWRM